MGKYLEKENSDVAGKPPASWRTFFSIHHKLGLSGKVTGPQDRRKTRHLGRCVPSSVSGAQEPNGSILQNIRKTFHGARKVRKYLSFSKNSRTSSPVLGSPDSSPQPCVFFFLSLKFSTARTFTSSVRKSRTSSIVVTAQTSERTGSGNPFFCS